MNNSMDQNSPQPVTSEIRFAVVMYGGVSLAIYMNGIAQELLHLVRSTARKGWRTDAESQFRFSEEELTGTERVYRQLAEVLTPGQERNGVRFIVDILSGTSAGGINGIYLAKALANGQSMDGLTRLWIEEGDLGKLLNDAQSKNGTNLSKPLQPKSLLNSDRMYVKLLQAFTEMDDPKAKPVNEGKVEGVARKLDGQAQITPELVEELDLFVTTTDIRGRVVPLRTSDRLVYERRYKYAFHFVYARPDDDAVPHTTIQTGRNDFALENNPFLSFAARCTSSFPFAFEPMRLEKIEELLPSFGGYPYKAQLEMWLRFFAPTQKQSEDIHAVKGRSFGDGGYLDNKPFEYAIEMLAKRSSDLPCERKLLYIEPAPEHPELATSKVRKAERKEPNALESSLAALVTLPGYEPIREDLLRVNERNRSIRKVTELIDGVIAGLWHSRGTRSVESQTHGTLSEIQAQRGAAYAGYNLLRVFDTTDNLADVAAKALDIERESSYLFAIRCIVRAWRELFYERGESIGRGTLSLQVPPPAQVNDPTGTTLNAFLDDFDLSYSIRKFRFVATQIDLLYRLDTRSQQRLAYMGIAPIESPKAGQDDGRVRPFLDGLCEIKKPMNDQFQRLRNVARYLHEDPALQPILAKLNQSLLDKVLGVTAPQDEQRGPFAPRLQDDDKEYVEHARQLLSESKDSADLISALNQIAELMRRQIRSAVGDGDFLSSFRHSGATGAKKDAYDAVLHFYDEFAEYDAALFPVIYGTDVGELDPVDIIRISPEDAVDIVDELGDNVRKLKGISLGHFGAFLDSRWRVNDILWGRLDAAERLIRSLLPNADGDELVRAAHDAILEDFLNETLGESGEQVLTSAIARIADQGGGF